MRCRGQKIYAQLLYIHRERAQSLHGIDATQHTMLVTMIRNGFDIVAKARRELDKAQTDEACAPIDCGKHILDGYAMIARRNKAHLPPQLLQVCPGVYIAGKLSLSDQNSISFFPIQTC